MRSDHFFKHVAINVPTNASGIASFSGKVPGVFGKFLTKPVTDPRSALAPVSELDTEGRLLDSIQVWGDTFVAGDRVSKLEIVDTDGVIPQNLRARFSGYPLIKDAFESAVPEGARIVHGLYLNGQSPSKFRFKAESFLFIPAELRILIEITAGVVTAGRIFRVNIAWGTVRK
jgi:hypothetical protein